MTANELRQRVSMAAADLASCYAEALSKTTQFTEYQAAELRRAYLMAREAAVALNGDRYSGSKGTAQ